MFIEDAVIPIYFFELVKDITLFIDFMKNRNSVNKDNIGVWTDFWGQMLVGWICTYLFLFQIINTIFKKPIYRNLHGLYM